LFKAFDPSEVYKPWFFFSQLWYYKSVLTVTQVEYQDYQFKSLTLLGMEPKSDSTDNYRTILLSY